MTLPAPTDMLTPASTQTVEIAQLERPGRLDAAAPAAARQLGYLPAHLAAGFGLGCPTGARPEARPPSRTRRAPSRWRYPDTPSQLQALWEPNGWTRMTQGAVMAFEPTTA